MRQVELQKMLSSLEESIKVLRTWYLYIELVPEAKQSVRFGGGKGKCWVDPKKAAYLKKLKKALKESYTGPVLKGMIRATVLYCFPWPESEVTTFGSLGWSLTDLHIDLDNLQKPLKDAMAGLIYTNDSQIVEIRCRKIRYHKGMIAVRIDEVMPQRLWKLQSIG